MKKKIKRNQTEKKIKKKQRVGMRRYLSIDKKKRK